MRSDALTRNTESRKQLCAAVEKAMREAGRIPEPAVLDRLPDDQLEAIRDYWSGGLFAY